MSKSDKRQKNPLIQLRCTEAEAEAIKNKAIVAGLTTSEYLRRIALNRRIQIRSGSV